MLGPLGGRSLGVNPAGMREVLCEYRALLCLAYLGYVYATVGPGREERMVVGTTVYIHALHLSAQSTSI
jgi:hypothetical protein